MIPTPAALLTPEQIDQIHEGSLEILEHVGVRVENDSARAIFSRHGCLLEAGSSVVKIPRAVVGRHLAALPGSFTYFGREPRYDRTIPGDGPLFTLGSAAPNVIDLETGRERRARSDDIARLAQIITHLNGFEVFNIAVTADDAPADQNTLSRIYPAFRHCPKPTLVSAPLPDEFDAVVRLGEMIAGSKEAYRSRPFLTFLFSNVISPLVLEDGPTESFVRTVAMQLPHYVILAPIAGLTAPFSLLGTLAQTNAEFLAVTILAQMVHPGTPVVYATLPIATDMRMADYASGGIENGMMLMGSAQMARRYGAPSAGYAGATNAKLNDAQAGFETGMNALAALLAGIDVLHMGGLLDALMALDFAKVMIDNEIALMLKHVWRGIESDREALAVGVMAEVGPGGAFVETDHTFLRMHTTTFFPQIANRETRDRWESAGKPDANRRALQLVNDMLASNAPAMISPELDAKIRAEFVNILSGDLR